jgi:uncharacterized protein YbjT (DUF2867 family)
MAPLHLMIFGPTGKLGAALVTLSLAQGYKVTVFVRTPTKLVPCAKAIVVVGDACDASAVSAAIATAAPDAVLVALGGPSIMSRDYNCSRGTDNILAGLRAMNGAIRPRLIVCSSMGVGDSEPFVPTFIKWMLKHALADKEPQEAAVKSSGYPFVLVRPTGLRDGLPRGPAALSCTVGGKTPTSTIARADVAAFMIEQVEGGDFLNKVVHLSWATT